MLKIKFFGIPQLTLGAEFLNLSLNSRDLALFAYLCVTRQPHSRSMLADLLWYDLSEQDAKNNLRYLLRNLKKEVGDYLLVDGQSVAFNQDLPHWCDATVFMTQLVPNASSMLAQTEPTLLQGVLDLYTGELLAGLQIQDALNFERWLLDQRRQLHDLLVYGVQLSAQQYLDHGEYEAGLALNQYLLTLEPWREEAHRQRMLLLAANGQRSAALMQYELCCQILEEELDAPPMDETTSLYLQIKSGQWFLGQKAIERHRNQRVAVLPYPSPPAHDVNAALRQPTAAARPASTAQVDLGSMPGADHFVGRQQELALLQQWVNAEDCRLVALLGLGGQGKSALAARFVQDQFSSAQNKQTPPTTAQTRSVIWRSLARRPSCMEILQDWVHQLTQQPRAELSANFDRLVTTLFAVLEERRCLFVLDGVEAVLQYDPREGRSEAEAYERLFQLFSKRRHRGCLLLTSRVRPMALTHLAQRNHQIHSLELAGLAVADGAALLAMHGIDTVPPVYQQLHQHYAGHPQLLSEAADLIYDLFDGDVNTFLAEEVYFMGNIGKTLAQQVAQCSPMERQVLQVLAEMGQALCRQQIWQQLSVAINKQECYQALRNLQHAYLLEQEEGQFKLPHVLARYLAERQQFP
ncbi:MAG: BTAD domain-containing putative transcriptional regulator [Caldilineaceae bacterium]